MLPNLVLPLLALLLLPQGVLRSIDIRLECKADNSICIHPDEQKQNRGGASRLRIKGVQHILLLDFDLTPIQGLAVVEARLFFKPAGPIKLKTLGISTVSAPWEEGRGRGEPQPGASCFAEAEFGKRAWAWPGSDFLAVTYGNGGSIWDWREVRVEKDGWMSVDIPAPVLSAMVEGNSYGLALSDEKGQTRANNDIFSREQAGCEPYILLSKIGQKTRKKSGARTWQRFSRSRETKEVRRRKFLGKYRAPEKVSPIEVGGGIRYRVLFEGETDPKARPAALIWNGREVFLGAARGEHVGFEVALELPEKTETTLKVSGIGWTASRALPVGRSFDPLIPVSDKQQGTVLLHLEHHVPTDARTGEHRRKIEFVVGSKRIVLPVVIDVIEAILPERLHFDISLNTYGSPGRKQGDPKGSKAYLDLERAYHRLAHEHRCTLAHVPYGQSGQAGYGMAPDVVADGGDLKKLDFEAWDRRWGPYFDGSAFEGLPRGRIPIDHFYLPLHENWPLPIDRYYAYKGSVEDHWKDAPPMEAGFPEEYGKAFETAATLFARHLTKRGWTGTDFQVYLNNKVQYRRKGRGSSWWNLDEPHYRDDFEALDYFARLFEAGNAKVESSPVLFRIDLSRPQWRRGSLEGRIGLNVCGTGYRKYPERVFDRGERVWTYGTVPAPGAPGEAPRAWCLQAFLDGCDGLVPWQTIGRQDSWSRPEATALILPARPTMEKRPYPTLRLKMLRRGQQDAELLRLYLERRGWSREEVRDEVAGFLGLAGAFRRSSVEDAGWIDFGRLEPARFEFLRSRLLEELETSRKGK